MPERYGHARPRFGSGLACAALLAGCTPNGYHDVKSVSMPMPGTALAVPSGDYHMVFLREPPHAGQANAVICSEPSPDWATSYAATRALSGSVSTPSGVSASAAGNFSDSTAIAQMAGRTAGVVALRDGLYQACQAFANGQLSRYDYALILSQYGTLLVALVGASSAPSGGGAQAGGSGSGGAPSVATPGTPSATTSAASGATGTGGDAAKTLSAAASPSLPALQMANAHVQAVLVSCLHAYEGGSDGEGKALQEILDAPTCKALIKSVSALVPHLLGTVPAPSAATAADH